MAETQPQPTAAARAIVDAAIHRLVDDDDMLGTELMDRVAEVVVEERERELALLREIVTSEAFITLLIEGRKAARSDLGPFLLAYNTWRREYG